MVDGEIESCRVFKKIIAKKENEQIPCPKNSPR